MELPSVIHRLSICCLSFILHAPLRSHSAGVEINDFNYTLPSKQWPLFLVGEQQQAQALTFRRRTSVTHVGLFSRKSLLHVFHSLFPSIQRQASMGSSVITWLNFIKRVGRMVLILYLPSHLIGDTHDFVFMVSVPTLQHT